MFQTIRTFFAKISKAFQNIDKAREDWLNSPINPHQGFDDAFDQTLC